MQEARNQCLPWPPSKRSRSTHRLAQKFSIYGSLPCIDLEAHMWPDIHMHACQCAYKHTYKYIYIYIDIDIDIDIDIYTDMCRYIHIYIYIDMYVYIYVYIYMYIYMYICRIVFSQEALLHFGSIWSHLELGFVGKLQVAITWAASLLGNPRKP